MCELRGKIRYRQYIQGTVYIDGPFNVARDAIEKCAVPGAPAHSELQAGRSSMGSLQAAASCRKLAMLFSFLRPRPSRTFPPRFPPSVPLALSPPSRPHCRTAMYTITTSDVCFTRAGSERHVRTLPWAPQPVPCGNFPKDMVRHEAFGFRDVLAREAGSRNK